MSASHSSLQQFRFQPEKVTAGTVYQYIKSNIDGSYPARIFIRLMDEANLDVWKFEAHNGDAAHVTAHMDWNIFSADRLQSETVTFDGVRRPQASLTFSPSEHQFHVDLRGHVDTVSVEQYPVHIYNFDFISLNVSLRHWTRPDGQVTFGVLQPSFDPDPDVLLKYEGTVTLRYIRDEQRNSHNCRMYEIDGEGLHHQRGTIWVDRMLGHIEDMEIPMADNPDWDDFKFKLIGSERMDEDTWTQFLQTEIQKLDPR